MSARPGGGGGAGSRPGGRPGGMGEDALTDEAGATLTDEAGATLTIPDATFGWWRAMSGADTGATAVAAGGPQAQPGGSGGTATRATSSGAGRAR